MPSKPVIVENYNPEWPKIFESLKAIYRSHLGDLVLDIQHVGSTSVPGLAAKPIIDIDLILSDMECFPLVVKRLERLGYYHNGNQGVQGREVFKRHSEQVPSTDEGKKWIKHHLYACVKGALPLRNHLAIRDYLRTHPEARNTYGNLKKELAIQFENDIDSYIDGKTALLISILQKAGFDSSEVDAITNINTKK